jgi:hypothetical protein
MSFISFPKIDIQVEELDKIKLPRMVRLKQHFDNYKIKDPSSTIKKELRTKINDIKWYNGKSIAITVGSRGIPYNSTIIKSIVEELVCWGAKPFIVPAMGSHGGAIAEGQKVLLENYGISEKEIGVPILSSMEVKKVGTLIDGTPIYCDKYASEADGIVIYNKIKPHTDFKGNHESGLLKMMAIGLANNIGASNFHKMGMQTFSERLPQVGKVFIENLPIVFGVAVVQNAYDEIYRLEVVVPDEIIKRDAELLAIAKKKMAKFMFDTIDLLIIDEIGKNISGSGFDPNIVGRNLSNNITGILNLQKLFIRGLSKESHNIGIGISLADITTRRCLNEINFEDTWANSITSTVIKSGSIPMYAETDKEAILIAIRTCNGIDFNNVKVVRIKNTLELSEIEVSESCLKYFNNKEDIEVLSEPYDMQFDEKGFLI